jgi:hypothetical protein
VAYECNTDFAPVLASRMDFFSNDPSADAINRVKGEILQVGQSSGALECPAILLLLYVVQLAGCSWHLAGT